MTVNEAGIYKVIVDSLGCVTEDSKEITSVLPMINLGSDLDLCSPATVTLQSPITAPTYSYSWMKSGTEISTSKDLTISRGGNYSLQVSANGCAPVQDEITVNSSLIRVKDDTLCESGTATLKALDEGDFVWYDQATDGIVLGSGSTLSIPVNNSKTVYVQETGGTSVNVGMKAPSFDANKAYDDNRFDRKLSFEVFAALRLDSLSVWSSTANNVVIRVMAANNSTVVYSITHTNIVQNKENRLKVGVELNPGTYYLDFEGTDGELFYSNENDLSINFPYTHAGLISITGGFPTWITDKPYYMYGYNWKVTTGNPCDRTPVYAIVDPGTCVLSNSKSQKETTFTIYPNPSTGVVNWEETTNWEVYSILGVKVAEGNGKSADLSNQRKGYYILKTKTTSTPLIIE